MNLPSRWALVSQGYESLRGKDDIMLRIPECGDSRESIPGYLPISRYRKPTRDNLNLYCSNWNQTGRKSLIIVNY